MKNLQAVVEEALANMKAEAVQFIDVREQTAITDVMAFATGNSRRHVRSIANEVVDASTEAGFKPLGIEGLETSEWVLVDLGDIVVHIMLEDVRDFYRLERIWGVE